MPVHPELDLSQVRRHSVSARTHKVSLADFAPRLEPPYAVPPMPRTLQATVLEALAADVVSARRAGKPILLGFGGHLVKVGVSRILIQLMEAGAVTGVATNGAGAIHDLEIARFGATSEDVGATLLDGTFGFAAETADAMNAAAARAAREKRGLGAVLGEALAAAPHAEASILAAAHRLGLPATVHVALGTDIVHCHPTCDGAAWGEATLRDFRIFAAQVARMGGGGVYVNAGSAVLLPEVFLKAVTAAVNLGHSFRGAVTAVVDLYDLYRPRTNVLDRPTADGGRSHMLRGAHEILLPILAARILALGGAPVRG